MRTLGDFIGKNRVVLPKERDDLQVARADHYLTATAQVLRDLFNHLPEVRQSYGHKTWTHFVSLALRLEQLKASGVTVRRHDYVHAHYWYYGADLEPWHLVGARGYAIYQAYMGQTHAEEVELSESEYAAYCQRTISRLAKLRDESPADTRLALTQSGLL